MEDYQDIYLDPPRANLFFNPVPRRGFRLVSFGDMIPIDDVAMFPGSVLGCYVVAVERGKKYTKEFAEMLKKPSLQKFNTPLLLPVGGFEKVRIIFYHKYSDKDGVPLFSQFSKLETDEDILQFACKYGQLKKQKEEFEIDSDKRDYFAEYFLESLQFWKSEISLVKQALTIWSSLEAREPVHQYLKPEGDKVLFFISGENSGKRVTLKAIQNESKTETVKRGLAQFIDIKMLEYPATVAHGVEERKIRGGETVKIPYSSFIRPTSLISAIWLQISQSFFKDGERDIIARRCFLTGDFFAESAMRQRNAEPFKGQYYSIRGMRNFQRQKNRRIEAAAEGKEVKPDRKGAMQFLVDFDALGEPVAEVAKAQKKTHPKK